MTYNELIATVGAKKVGDTYMVKCPAHADKTASLSISQGDDGKILLHCFAGCEPQKIIDAWNMAWTDLWPEDASPPERKKPRRKKAQAEADPETAEAAKTADAKPQKSRKPMAASKRIIAEYIYEDADGQKRYKVRRYVDKSFDQCRWAINEPGKAGWIPGLKGVELLLYRLPQLNAAIAAGKTIFVTEGEKDVHTLEALGFTATTNSGGAQKKWRDNYFETLRGANVIILPDNDLPGKAHARAIMRGLDGVAAKARVLLLPDLPDTGDVTDWVEAGGTAQKLIALVKSSATTETTALDSHRDADGYTQIDITDKCLREIGRDIINALEAANEPPYIYRYADGLARIRKIDKGEIAEKLEEPNTKCRIADVLNLVTISEDGKISQYSATRDQTNYVLHGDYQPYPILAGIVRTPILRPSGTVLQTTGYDAETTYYYAAQMGLEPLDVPDNPTAQDVKNAIGLIDELIYDFPFVDESSKTNALAVFLTPLVRAIAPLSPLALMDAPKAGTGKSLLALLVSLVATGPESGTHSIPHVTNEDEWHKKITSALRGNADIIIIDNLDPRRRLSSSALASVLTKISWTDRILGESKMITLQNTATWMATGNNISVDAEIGRRSYLIRMDTQLSDPESRDPKKFRHPRIEKWAKANRHRILSALFTLIRNWFAGGCKIDENAPLMGSYETWVETISGILAAAGIPGFLSNRRELRERADMESQQWEAFLAQWTLVVGRIPITVIDLTQQYLIAGKPLCGVLPDEIARGIQHQTPDTRKISHALRARLNTRYGAENYRVVQRNKRNNAVLWTVESDVDEGGEDRPINLVDIGNMGNMDGTTGATGAANNVNAIGNTGSATEPELILDDESHDPWSDDGGLNPL